MENAIPETQDGITIWTSGEYISPEAWKMAFSQAKSHNIVECAIQAEYGIHGDGYRLFTTTGQQICRFDV